MITAQLKTSMSRRSEPVRETIDHEYRDDVLTYGRELFEALEQRKDFDALREHDSKRKAHRSPSK